MIDPRDDVWLAMLDDEQRRVVMLRRRVVVGWERTVAEGKGAGLLSRDVTPGYLASLAAEGLRVSRSTLSLWRRAYRADGLFGLVDQRSLAGRAERFRQLRPFYHALARRYLAPGMLSIRICHDLTVEWAAGKGRPAATLRESDRYIRTFVLPELRKGAGSMVRRPNNGRSSDI